MRMDFTIEVALPVEKVSQLAQRAGDQVPKWHRDGGLHWRFGGWLLSLTTPGRARVEVRAEPGGVTELTMHLTRLGLWDVWGIQKNDCRKFYDQLEDLLRTEIETSATNTRICLACAEEVDGGEATCPYCGWNLSRVMRSINAVPGRMSAKAATSIIAGFITLAGWSVALLWAFGNLFVLGTTAAVAVVAGAMALWEISTSRGALAGASMAVAGTVLGALGLLGFLVVLVANFG